jgi:hypothetical protein
MAAISFSNRACQFLGSAEGCFFVPATILRERRTQAPSRLAGAAAVRQIVSIQATP